MAGFPTWDLRRPREEPNFRIRPRRYVCSLHSNYHKQAFADPLGVASFVDLALAIYPIILFWDLRVKLFKKLVLSVLFAFGIVCVQNRPRMVTTYAKPRQRFSLCNYPDRQRQRAEPHA